MSRSSQIEMSLADNRIAPYGSRFHEEELGKISIRRIGRWLSDLRELKSPTILRNVDLNLVIDRTAKCRDQHLRQFDAVIAATFVFGLNCGLLTCVCHSDYQSVNFCTISLGETTPFRQHSATLMWRLGDG